MKPRRRGTWVASGLFVGLFALASWAYQTAVESRAAAQHAAENLTTCRRLAAKIGELRGGPPRALLMVRSSQELHRRIDTARAAAGAPAEALERIDPEPPRPLGRSSYQEQLTHVTFSQVTLRQLTTFGHTVVSGEIPWNIARIRLLAAPLDASGAETWQAEVTLTSLIFSPKTGVARK